MAKHKHNRETSIRGKTKTLHNKFSFSVVEKSYCHIIKTKHKLRAEAKSLELNA